MAKMYLNRAIARAVDEEMNRDENVILLGCDIQNVGGGMSVFMGVPQKHPDRCFDMPLSEAGYTHFANGMALAGARPIVDLMFSDFSTIASDAIINGASKVGLNTLGQKHCPTVYIMGNGGRGTYGGFGSGCNHSQCSESWFANVPGLKILTPYYPADALGLLKSAIRDEDPVIFMYHEGSLGVSGEIPEDQDAIPINDAANILKEGEDITIVAVQSMVPIAMKAAGLLEEKGIHAEVIDPRVLVPLDEKKLIASAKKTGHVIVVHEAPRRGGFGGEIASTIAEGCNGDNIKICRIGGKNAPIASGPLEYYLVPKVDDIVKAAEELLK